MAIICVFGFNSVYAQTETGTGQEEEISEPFTTYTCDFDDESQTDLWTVNNGTCVNKWIFGTPKFNQKEFKSKALFVSSDGINAEYNNTAQSVTTVSRNLFLGDNDSVSVKFDLALMGEAGNDYLKVFLAPLDAEFEASLTSTEFSNKNYSTNALKFGNFYYLDTTGTDFKEICVKAANPSKTDSVKLVFVWVNDDSYGTNPAAVIDNLVVAASDISFATVCNDSLTLDKNDKVVDATGLYTVIITNPQDNSKQQQKVYYTVIPQDTTILNETICENGIYTKNGFSVNVAGQHILKMQNTTTGCDSVVILNLFVNDTVMNEIFDTVCEADLPYLFNGLSLTKSGDYSTMGLSGVELKTINGCDSTVILHLKVDSVTVMEYDTALCYAQTFEYRTITASESGTYYDTVLTEKGCIDTLRIVNVLIREKSDTTLYDTICYQSNYTFAADPENVKILSGLTSDRIDKDSVILKDQFGCDSTVRLHLTVLPKIEKTVLDTICFGSVYNFAGKDTLLTKEQFAAGDVTVNLDTVLTDEMTGCDSFLTVKLYVKPQIDTFKIEGNVCFGDTVKYGSKEYVCNTEGVFTDGDTIKSLLYPDCDSVILVNINVWPQVVDGYIDTTICYHGTYTHDSVASAYSFAESDTTLFMDTLYLKNANGCDSTVYLTIHILENPSVAVYDTICYDSTYTYLYVEPNGDTVPFTSANKTESFVKLIPYQVKTVTSNGGTVYCDRTDTLYITVREKIDSLIKDTVCFGESYFFAGKDTSFNITEGDQTITLRDTLQSELCNCDSTVTVQLYIHPKADTTKIDQTICFGDTVIYGPYADSVHVYATGDIVYTDTLHVVSEISSCDSMIYLVKVNVLPKVIDGTVDLTVCANDTVEYAFTNYKENFITETINKKYSYQDTTGIFNDTVYLKNANLCDSVVYVNIKVNPVYDTTVYDTICDNEFYTLNEVQYNLDGKYEQYLKTVDGCDSIVRLYLTVNKTASTTFNVNICEGESYIENNFNAQTTGTFIQSLQTTNGCDSTVTLNLTVNAVYDDTITVNQCYGVLYNDNGFTVSQQGVYTHNYKTVNGCDSSITLVLNILDADTVIDAVICDGESYLENGFNEKVEGTYTKILKTYSGCDSTVTLNLTVIPQIVTNINATICQGEVYQENGFNASTPGKKTAVYENQYGCDSTVILNLIVNPVYDTDIVADICAGEIYNDNGFIQSTTGTYTHNLHTINGCDSTVTLILNVKDLSSVITASICEGTTYTENGFNASKTGQYSYTVKNDAGCDSVVTLNLMVNPVYDTVINAEICEGQTYAQNGFNATSTGTFTQELKTLNGCDSNVTLNLVVNEAVIANISASICEGETYTQYGFSANKTGTFTKQFTSYKGCDSTLMLNLTVNPVYDTTINATIWYGDLYDKYGFLASDNGTYIQNKQSINGCDSTLKLILTVIDKVDTTINASICAGATYNKNGFNVSAAGTYHQYLKNFKNLDSTVTLNLTVNPVYDTTIYATICKGETYNLNGFNKKNAGTYTQNLKTINGCDSVVKLNLTVNEVYNTPLSATICQGETYKLNGFNASTAGTYTKTLTSAGGCDSVITLTLNVNPLFDTSINATICYGEVYTLNGFNDSLEGVYTKYLKSSAGCDSTITLNLTVAPLYEQTITASVCEGETYNDNGFNENETGIYTLNLTSSQGCDSIVHLDLAVNKSYHMTVYDTMTSNQTGEDYSDTQVEVLQTVNGCDSIIATITYYHFTSGLDDATNTLTVSIYPNPAKENITLDLGNSVLNITDEVVITNTSGQIVYKSNIPSSQFNIDVSGFESGVYYVRIGKQYRKLIIK